MTTKKISILITILLLSLLLASCGIKGFGNTSSKKTENFREGTEGITVSFKQTFGKEIPVFGEKPEIMSFLVELKNLGSYPEKEGASGAVWLSGFDRSLITAEGEGFTTFEGNPQGEIYLPGKSSINPEGGAAIKDFKATIESKSLKEGKYQAKVLANVCYHYSTIANPAVCIEKAPFQLSTEKKPCVMSDVSLSSQGAPIAITKIEPMSTSDRIQFKITIKNVGKGIAMSPSLDCNRDTITTAARYDLNVVSIERRSLAGKELECGASVQNGMVKLIDGIGYFTCSILKEDLGSDASAFSTPLDITLTYLYRDSVETPLTINKIP